MYKRVCFFFLRVRLQKHYTLKYYLFLMPLYLHGISEYFSTIKCSANATRANAVTKNLSGRYPTIIICTPYAPIMPDNFCCSSYLRLLKGHRIVDNVVNKLHLYTLRYGNRRMSGLHLFLLILNCMAAVLFLP